jgi:hypothetical protein
LAATAQVKSGGFSDWKRSREEPGYYLYSGRESARCKHNHHHHPHLVVVPRVTFIYLFMYLFIG